MRHALVPVHLIKEARTATTGPTRRTGDAPAEARATSARRHRRTRRLAVLARRARA